VIDMREDVKALLETLSTGENKRRYARFDICVPAVLWRVDGGRPFRAVATNISMDGVQLRCPAEEARSLYSDTQPFLIDEGLDVEIALKVPLKNGSRLLSALCKVCYLGNTNADSVLLGLQFIRFFDRGVAARDAFLLELMEPYINSYLAYVQTWTRR
jgi:hypothetical protein